MQEVQHQPQSRQDLHQQGPHRGQCPHRQQSPGSSCAVVVDCSQSALPKNEQWTVPSSRGNSLISEFHDPQCVRGNVHLDILCNETDCEKVHHLFSPTISFAESFVVHQPYRSDIHRYDNPTTHAHVFQKVLVLPKAVFVSNQSKDEATRSKPTVQGHPPRPR